MVVLTLQRYVHGVALQSFPRLLVVGGDFLLIKFHVESILVGSNLALSTSSVKFYWKCKIWSNHSCK